MRVSAPPFTFNPPSRRFPQLLFESRKRGAAKTLRIKINKRKRRIHAEPPPPLFISLPSSHRPDISMAQFTPHEPPSSHPSKKKKKKKIRFFPQCASGRYSAFLSHRKHPHPCRHTSAVRTRHHLPHLSHLNAASGRRLLGVFGPALSALSEVLKKNNPPASTGRRHAF